MFTLSDTHERKVWKGLKRMDKIVMLKAENVRYLELFLRGSGDPSEDHPIIGIRWVDNEGIEQGFGETVFNRIDVIENL